VVGKCGRIHQADDFSLKNESHGGEGGTVGCPAKLQ
jgi:hypothetical protein